MTDTAGEPLLLTIKQACARLNIGRSKFYELRNAGLIRVVDSLGPQTPRVHVRDLEELAERLRQQAGVA